MPLVLDRETRCYGGSIQLRAAAAPADAGPGTITGHAAVFDQLSDDLGGWRERIAPGAFARAIQRDDVRALWNHSPMYVLGRTAARTLRLSEDDHGLAVEVDPPAGVSWVADLMHSIERGDVTQMSFGFRTILDEWDLNGPLPVRTLREVELFDVSPVTFPAYPQTDVAVRMSEWIAELRAEGGRAATPPAGAAAAARARLAALRLRQRLEEAAL